jgi:hypothetical protein
MLLEFDKLLESVKLLEKIETVIFDEIFKLVDFAESDHFFGLYIFVSQCLYLKLRGFGNSV